MPTATPEISVLMPVRNAETTISGTLESVIAQTFQNWELVIINDGSTDHTPAILDQFDHLDTRIHVHHLPPRGIVHALNHGIQQCRGQWIARIDADDLMFPRRLALQWQHAFENPELGVISGLVENGGTSRGFQLYVDWLNTLTSPHEIALNRFIESPVAHPSVMFRKDLIDLHGGYRHGDFPEDYELWLRWMAHGVRFGKVRQTIIRWHDAPARLTRTDPRYANGKFYSIKLPHLASWLRENVCPSREIWLWGAGRVTRKRFASLPSHGIPITGYIDIDPNKCSPRRDHLQVILPDSLPPKHRAFVVTCVAKHGARALICQHLESHGYTHGPDFIHAA